MRRLGAHWREGGHAGTIHSGHVPVAINVIATEYFGVAITVLDLQRKFVEDRGSELACCTVPMLLKRYLPTLYQPPLTTSLADMKEHKDTIPAAKKGNLTCRSRLPTYLPVVASQPSAVIASVRKLESATEPS